MPLTIPAPEVHGDAKYTWTATAEQKPEGEGLVTIYRYEIIHEDGTKTKRIVTDRDGVVSTEESKERAKAVPSVRVPIAAPRDLPENAAYDARRVVFTDEKDRVTTTVNYTVYIRNHGKYTQSEVHHFNGETTVTKGDLQPLDPKDEDTMFNDEPDEETTVNKKVPTKVVDKENTTLSQNKSDAFSEPSCVYKFDIGKQQDAPPPQSSSRHLRARGNVAARYLQNLK